MKKALSKRNIRIKIILLREETSDKLKTIKVSAIKYQQIKPYCDKYNSELLFLKINTGLFLKIIC